MHVTIMVQVGSVDANVTLTDNAETNQLIVSANATKLRYLYYLAM